LARGFGGSSVLGNAFENLSTAGFEEIVVTVAARFCPPTVSVRERFAHRQVQWS
jgi:hypothetical protein